MDGDLDGVNDADEMGYCVPTGVGTVTVCLPDCSAGTCDASGGTGTYYCQPLEAEGTGLLTDLLDDASANSSPGIRRRMTRPLVFHPAMLAHPVRIVQQQHPLAAIRRRAFVSPQA